MSLKSDVAKSLTKTLLKSLLKDMPGGSLMHAAGSAVVESFDGQNVPRDLHHAVAEIAREIAASVLDIVSEAMGTKEEGRMSAAIHDFIQMVEQASITLETCLEDDLDPRAITVRLTRNVPDAYAPPQRRQYWFMMAEAFSEQLVNQLHRLPAFELRYRQHVLKRLRRIERGVRPKTD